MKRIILSIFLVLLLLSIPLSVSAHAGKTDSQGGHTDWSTGEYHYHHGYPAHDHYDMDGDGILDCPYDFVDKTNHSSSGSSSSGYTGYSLPAIETRPLPTFPKATDSTVPIKTQSKNESGEETMSSFWKYLIGAMIITIVVLLFKLWSRNEDIKILKRDSENTIEWLRKKSQQETDKIKSEYENRISSLEGSLRHKDESFTNMRNNLLSQIEQSKSETKKLKSSLKSDLTCFDSIFREKCGDNYLYKLFGAPKGDYVCGDNLPSTLDGSPSYWGDKYTFYTSSKGIKYHSKNCRHVGNYSIPVNSYTIYSSQGEYVPCQQCKPELPDLNWYISYRLLIEFRSTYLK